MRASRLFPFLVLVVLLACAAACSSQTTAVQPRFLDRPGDMAFGCIATLLNDAGVSTGESRAYPLSACEPQPDPERHEQDHVEHEIRASAARLGNRRVPVRKEGH